jgi:hypothetical protein
VKIEIEPYEVGKFYRIPTVKVMYNFVFSIWPVLGTWHEDAEMINFPDYHYHFDARFLTERQAEVVDDNAIRPGEGVFKNVVLYEASEIVVRLRKCRRIYAKYPAARVPWMGALEAEYGRNVLKSAVCPHRRTPLDGLQVENGCVTCPLHGLLWNCETGKLQPHARTMK